MTDITIAEVANLAESVASTDDIVGNTSRKALSIGSLGLPRRSETVLDSGLVNKTLTFEARDWTIVLDFDNLGFLTRVTFS
jgi:hypothetical protein